MFLGQLMIQNKSYSSSDAQVDLENATVFVLDLV